MKIHFFKAVLFVVPVIMACTQEERPSASTEVESLTYGLPADTLTMRVNSDGGKLVAEDADAIFEVVPESMADAVCATVGTATPPQLLVAGRTDTTVVTLGQLGCKDGKVVMTVMPSSLPQSVLTGDSNCSVALRITLDGKSCTSNFVHVAIDRHNLINGTELLEENTLYGLVSDASTGKGIPDVPVTDGYNYVRTDANGVYQMKPDSRCRKVYLSFPAEYEIPMDEHHRPQIYCDGNVTVDAPFRWDWALTPLKVGEKNFTLMMISDPQCSKLTNVTRYINETVADMKTYLNEQQAKGKWTKCYAFTLGDIISDSSNIWDDMVGSMSDVQLDSGYLPFFQCIGNHDHDGTVSGENEAGDYNATHYFFEKMGPTDYSVNRGDVHILVMDDVLCTTPKTSTAPNGYTWGYNDGFTDDQWNWLQQDMATVADKQDKMIVLCMHIPVRKGLTSGGASFNIDRHYAELLTALTQFKEAHIMIGHTHYCHNWIHKDYVCKGGKPIYEHVHDAACGAWWSCHSNTSGGPNNYTLYEVRGASVRDWLDKPVGLDPSYQLRVYDGSQIYTGKKSYQCAWYSPTTTMGSVTAKGYSALEGCFVAQVWNDDDTNWKVEYFQNGTKIGNFVRVPDGTCCNMAITSYFFNQLSKTSTNYATATASHYWYYKPESMAPVLETNWEVRATQTIPSSGVSHVFKCSKLTTDYSEF